MFVSGSCDKTARLWDTHVASRAVRTFHGHEGDVNSVKFFPDGNRFGAGTEDGTCRVFDIRIGHQLQAYPPEQGDCNTPSLCVTSIAFSISGRLLFASYSNGDCFLWDTLLAEAYLWPSLTVGTTLYYLSVDSGPSGQCLLAITIPPLPFNSYSPVDSFGLGV
ncbi:guanine nucleotide-binding protein subunit beta-2 [Artemisia annua]|uniref:Guanine nucleotide-binding protein subunit beta-2 n=1 Tax=Artemisia annua TaxID=35608 RepID=A0A2U1LAY8_ARTAN|nr:guanine nucleotide-binding protein subunit beta-2 [Artemisia annua]